MKNLFVWSTLFFASTVIAGVTSVEGTVDFLLPKTNETVKYNFAVEWFVEEGVSKLRLWTPGTPATPQFQYISQPGEAFLESARVESLSKESGNLLFVFWGRGASAVWLTVLGLKPDGRVGVVFDGACHGGYQVLDVIGDGSRQIVEVVEGYGAKSFTTNIYRFTPEGGISLFKTEKVSRPHFYSFPK